MDMVASDPWLRLAAGNMPLIDEASMAGTATCNLITIVQRDG
jgi:hypothetical protein